MSLEHLLSVGQTAQQAGVAEHAVADAINRGVLLPDGMVEHTKSRTRVPVFAADRLAEVAASLRLGFHSPEVLL